jgi:hypothetical protein
MRHAEGMTEVQSKSKKTKRQKMDTRSGGREVKTRKRFGVSLGAFGAKKWVCHTKP